MVHTDGAVTSDAGVRPPDFLIVPPLGITHGGGGGGR